MSDLHSINAEQRLYVLKCGAGVSCLGFDVAEKRRAAYAKWLGEEAPTIEPGTPEAYHAYRETSARVVARCAATKSRCPAQLTPQLIGLEGKHVEVISPDGSKRRFYVGKSAGPIPIHLEIARRDSSGGCGAYVAPGDKVRVVGAY